jgi:hypothetical protein
VAVERVNAQQAGEPGGARARPSPVQPSLGRGLDPATALALQRTAGNRALVRALQRYSIKQYKTTRWRQADDLSLATRVGYPNHQLFAKPGKVAKSNTALRAVGSDIELVDTGREATFWNNDNSTSFKLNKVEAKNKVNGTQGDAMLLYADCGRSASVVVGKLRRQAVFKDAGARAVAPGSPDEMKSGIMKKWLPGERAKKLAAKNQADADQIQDALTKGAQREGELPAIAARWSAATTDVMKKAIAAEYSAKLAEMGNAYLSYYNSRPEAERRRIDQELGINTFARPTVGQGYTTSSGGAAVPGAASTWNFHWSGVIMQSDDSRDNVVIENYSVSNWDTENNDWTFETYGTGTASQTFHERHKATDQHGQTPTTMVIENQP